MMTSDHSHRSPPLSCWRAPIFCSRSDKYLYGPGARQDVSFLSRSTGLPADEKERTPFDFFAPARLARACLVFPLYAAHREIERNAERLNSIMFSRLSPVLGLVAPRQRFACRSQ